MMKTNILLPQVLLPKDTIELGGLIVDVKNPLHDSYTSPTPIPATSVLRTEIADFSLLQQNTASREVQAFLTRALSAGWGNKDALSVEIKSLKETTYLLRNTDTWFTSLLGSSDARQWINRAVDRSRSVFLVVGFRTVFDASISTSHHSHRTKTGEVAVPVAEIVTASTGVPIFPGGSDLLDTGVGVRKGRGRNSALAFVAPGESVYALQVRKLRFKWYSKKQADSAVLDEKNRWTVFGERGYATEETRDDGDGHDDVLEVSLSDTPLSVEVEEKPWESSLGTIFSAANDQVFLLPSQ